MDYLLEQYELYDAYDDIILEKLNPDTMYNEIYEMYTEASTGVTKGNIFSKIVKFIIKAGQWIWEKLGLLLTNIKKFFSKVKNTADSIMDEMKVNFNIKPIKLPKLPDSIKIKGIGKEKDIDIKIENMLSPILIKIDKNKDVKFLFLKTNMFPGLSYFNLYKLKNNNSMRTHYRSGYTLMSLNMIMDNKFDKVLTNLENFTIENQKELFNSINEFMELEKQHRPENLKEQYELSLNDLNKVSENIKKLVLVMEKFDNLDYNFKQVNHKLVSALNSLQELIMNIQISVNILSELLNKTSLVNLRYFNSIKDDETLSKIVEKMIQYNFPMKSILANINILTGFREGIEIKHGAGRAVYIGKKYVKKISYNFYGLKSNKNEIRISESGVELGVEIAKVLSYTNNSYILTMEKIIPSKTDQPTSLELLETNEKIYFKNQLPHHKVEDLFTSDNITKTSDGRLVMIDYGFLKLKGGSLDDI